MRPVVMKVADRQKDTHTHTETDKAMAIGEIANFPTSYYLDRNFNAF